MANSTNAARNPWFSLTSMYSGYLRRRLAAAGLSCRKIDLDDGSTTVQFWGPTADDSSSKPALVFIHGFGPEATWQWRQQATFFAGKFRVYVPNLLFFGESTTQLPERSEIFQATTVGKLMEKLGVERYSIVGTSYGGWVSYRLAHMWPDRVEKVVIASSAVNLKKSDNDEMLKRAKVEKTEDVMLPVNSTQLKKLLGVAVFKKAYVPTFLLNDMIARLYSDQRDRRLELLKGLSFGHDENVSVSPLKQDVLIVWGEHDKVFPLEKAKELKELLGEKAQLEVMKNTSHVPQIEEPEIFNNILRKFLCDES